MPERSTIEDEIRRLYPEPVPTADASRELAREALVAELGRGTSTLAARSPMRSGSRWLLPAGAAVCAAVAALVLVLLGGPDGRVSTSSAAEVLQQAAAAERELAPPLPGPGEYLYVKSESAYLSSTLSAPAGRAPAPGTPPGSVPPEEAVAPEISYSYLEPNVREVWMGEYSLLKTRFGTPTFLSEEDREAWEADGSPGAKGGTETDPLGRNEPIDLPSDPDVLLMQLREKAGRYVDGFGYGAAFGTPADDLDPPPPDLDLARAIDVEVFSRVGESLREQSATPAQRAALLEVASRLEGIELAGETTDSIGRPGIAVAMTDPEYGMRHSFVFDSETSALLGEQEEVATDAAMFDYPIGTVVGWSAYLEAAIVEERGVRP